MFGYKAVSITFRGITEEEKSLVHEKTRDEWTYKYKLEPECKTTYQLIFKLVQRGDRKNEPVVVFDDPNQVFILSIGQEVGYNGQSGGSFTFHYGYRILKCDSRPGSIGYDLQALMRDRDEITLVASDGTEFSINKFIFMARSEVFKAIFDNDTKEKQENKVNFRDIPANVLEKLVMFLTTDEVVQMDDNVAHQLGLVCHRYGLPLLFEQVEDYFYENCNEDNLDFVTELIHLHKSLKLANAFVNFKNETYPTDESNPYEPIFIRVKQRDRDH